MKRFLVSMQSSIRTQKERTTRWMFILEQRQTTRATTLANRKQLNCVDTFQWKCLH